MIIELQSTCLEMYDLENFDTNLLNDLGKVNIWKFLKTFIPQIISKKYVYWSDLLQIVRDMLP